MTVLFLYNWNIYTCTWKDSFYTEKVSGNHQVWRLNKIFLVDIAKSSATKEIKITKKHSFMSTLLANLVEIFRNIKSDSN